MAVPAAREIALPRGKEERVGRLDELRLRLGALAHHDQHVRAGEHRRHGLRAAPPAPPPRLVAARLAVPVGVLAHGNQHQHHRRLLNVARDRLDRQPEEIRHGVAAGFGVASVLAGVRVFVHRFPAAVFVGFSVFPHIALAAGAGVVAESGKRAALGFPTTVPTTRGNFPGYPNAALHRHGKQCGLVCGGRGTAITRHSALPASGRTSQFSTEIRCPGSCLLDPGQRISKKTTSFNLSISIRRGSGIYTPPSRARACAATGWAGYG